ncbi:TetR/AcrR family transcriptional regulator [Paraburkholderia phytofirmans]|jgi:AcrR family transcriptional regulator|uniref:TetR/AcrR family transcriptional regulator n=1 Tax=Paraburkholderia sp. BL9I2N2 TaxID=1938809 RepID=UPI00104369F9|nr:TetR/AcrR family transcriptional regulator [Paraburkholderia sp. BL9I2N2]TCK88573.1 TetR family transcriptional regulator [Paraburkholderia sp. BL9I2N2]
MKKQSEGRQGALKRRGTLGRPAGATENQKESILDAAEVDFSHHGYAGTTLREVAVSCGVTQALITYYFGTKQQLFEEVFLRRATKISDDRVQLLREIEARGKDVELAEIVRAFLKPIMALRSTVSGRAFIRLQARLHTEPPEVSYKLRNLAYNESTGVYVQALRRVLPGLPEKDLYWRVTLMIGAYLYAFSDSHRLEVLAKDICNPSDPVEVLEQLTCFVVGGLQAAAAK